MNQTEMHSKKNILIFTLSPPLPADSGAPIYITNTILPLVEKYNFHLFTIGGESEKDKINKNKHLYEKVFKSVHIEARAKMPSEKGLIGQALHAIKHIYHGLPFMDASYFSESAVDNAKKIIKEKNINAIEIHSSHLAFFKKFLPKIPALLVSHNIESDIFPFWIPQNIGPFKKKLIEHIANISRKNAHNVEIENSLKFNVITFISENDLNRVTTNVEKHYIPLCLPIKEIDYREKTKDHCNILWMGGFWWYPNSEGILWFIKNIYPIIKDNLSKKKIRLHFLGTAPPEELKSIHDGKNVFVHGYIDSIEAILNNAHILFVPLLSGGGVRVKILEAMSNGIPVISTSKGCEGLGVTDGKNIIIRNDPASFAEELMLMVDNEDQRNTISINGTSLLKDKFNLNKYISKKDEIYKKLCGK